MLTGSCHCGACRYRFDGDPDSATACNCTVCRRYGALWAYDWEGERVTLTGPTAEYVRGPDIGFRFCATCGCVVAWRSLVLHEGRRRIAVNLRMADDPDAVAGLPIRHFDGLDRFEDLPRDHRHVGDLWF